MSPPVGSTCFLPALPTTCAASSRADALWPVPTDEAGRGRMSDFGSGIFLAGGFEKNAIAMPVRSIEFG
jgi:hypothetical protein